MLGRSPLGLLFPSSSPRRRAALNAAKRCSAARIVSSGVFVTLGTALHVGLGVEKIIDYLLDRLPDFPGSK
jgi:hypothetical protein